jgi:hypothetical protein
MSAAACTCEESDFKSFLPAFEPDCIATTYHPQAVEVAVDLPDAVYCAGGYRV